MSLRAAKPVKIQPNGQKPAAKPVQRRSEPATTQMTSHPARLDPRTVLGLQGAAGNQVVARMLAQKAIQAKLTVGAANDGFEQEADRVAQQVMSPKAEAGVQRTEEDDTLQAKPLAASISSVAQRKSGGGEARAVGGAFEADAGFESRLKSNQGGGQAMPGETREFMESRFGADFSAVRLHTDSSAAQLSRDVQAQAFTHGQDIYMGEGKYNPQSETGKALLAHELTHTIQQGGAQRIQREGEVDPKKTITEHQAALINDVLFDNPVNVDPNDKAGKQLESLKRSFRRLLIALSESPSTEPKALDNAKTIVLGLQQLATLGKGGGYVKSGLEEDRLRRLEKSAHIGNFLRKNYQGDPTKFLVDNQDEEREDPSSGKTWTKKASGRLLGTTSIDSKKGKIGAHLLGGLMNIASPITLPIIHSQILYSQARKGLFNYTKGKVENEANEAYNEPLGQVRNGLEEIVNGNYGKKVKAACSEVTAKLETFLKKRNAQSFSASGGKGARNSSSSVSAHPHLQVHFPKLLKKYTDWKIKKEKEKGK